MNTSMSKKEALSICGSLSRPSKMPGPSYSLPAEKCRIGSLLQHVRKSVCAHCYALRGRYVFPVVRRAMEKRLASLNHPRWVDAVSSLIRRCGEKHFRWHDSGDIQSIQHLENIVAVCRNLPHVKFWLPTREYQTVEAYRRMGGEIPPNLCLRYSAHIINGQAPTKYGLPVSTVSRRTGETGGAYRCPAAKKGNRCGRCRACWDSQVRMVEFPLNWAGPPRRSERRGVVL